MSAHYQQHASYAQAPYAHNYYAVPVIAHPVARQQSAFLCVARNARDSPELIARRRADYVQPPLHVQLAPAQLITRRCNDCNRGFAGSAELEVRGWRARVSVPAWALICRPFLIQQHQNFGRGACVPFVPASLVPNAVLALRSQLSNAACASCTARAGTRSRSIRRRDTPRRRSSCVSVVPYLVSPRATDRAPPAPGPESPASPRSPGA